MSKKILIAEADPQACASMASALAGVFEVKIAVNGKQAYELATNHKPDLILMNETLPVQDGISTTRKIRKEKSNRGVPIILISSETSSQRLAAFSSGIDGLLCEPINSEELIACVHSKLKRTLEMRIAPPEWIEVGNLFLNLKSREATLAGIKIETSPVEFDILKILVQRAGQIVTRKEIMKTVWQDGRKSGRLIDSHMTFLRRKLESFNGQIQVVYGQGYRIKSESSELASSA